jgi:hypothetical protein
VTVAAAVAIGLPVGLILVVVMRHRNRRQARRHHDEILNALAPLLARDESIVMIATSHLVEHWWGGRSVYLVLTDDRLFALDARTLAVKRQAQRVDVATPPPITKDRYLRLHLGSGPGSTLVLDTVWTDPAQLGDLLTALT